MDHRATSTLTTKTHGRVGGPACLLGCFYAWKFDCKGIVVGVVENSKSGSNIKGLIVLAGIK